MQLLLVHLRLRALIAALLFYKMDDQQKDKFRLRIDNIQQNYIFPSVSNIKVVFIPVMCTKNKPVNLYCPEAPEVLFQDFGKGTLVNGAAHIVLDETFIKNVTVNDNHPLRVIIQLEGDCNGVGRAPCDIRVRRWRRRLDQGWK